MEPTQKGRSTLFRQEALEHLLKEEELREPLRVSPPWTWSLLYIMGALLLIALWATIFGKVEVKDMGRGALRPLHGASVLQSPGGGVLTACNGRPGDPFQQGQTLAVIQPPRTPSRPTPTAFNVSAGESGFLETWLVNVGDTVQPSQGLARWVPQGAPLQVVAFISEKSWPYLKVGDRVVVELDAFPVAQFGTLKGRISRVGNALASGAELHEMLGEESRLGPSYRVELELFPERSRPLQNMTLRSGMLVNARFTLRRQRLITLLFDPLRRWLE